MDKYLPYEHAFNEELLAKELFALKENKVKSIVMYNIRNSSFVTIFSLVAKYLLHVEKISPEKTREYLRKYAVIISYLYLNSVSNITFQFKLIELENIIADINVSSLSGNLDDKGLFANLYNDVDFYKTLKQLIKKIKNDGKDKVADAIYKVLRGEFNYFSKRTNVTFFTEYPDMKRFDMIVSEALLDSKFNSFSFSVNFEEFKANFTTEKPTNDQIRMAITFIGYIVYDVFNNSNVNFIKEINYISNKMLVLATLNKDVSVNKMNLSFLSKEKEQVIINWQELSNFSFIYNGIEGTFNYKKIEYSML